MLSSWAKLKVNGPMIVIRLGYQALTSTKGSIHVAIRRHGSDSQGADSLPFYSV